MANCLDINIVKDSLKFRTRVVANDEGNDLSLLKTNTVQATVATFRGGKGIRAGDDVFAFGYPLQGVLSDRPKITKGMVNSLQGMGNDTRMMQISAPVQPGNSGGPLLDYAGNVVGVVTSKMDAILMAEYTGDIAQNVNFAIKASLTRDFLDANSIDYETAPSTTKLEAADIADKAEKFTVLVECWQ